MLLFKRKENIFRQVISPLKIFFFLLRNSIILQASFQLIRNMSNIRDIGQSIYYLLCICLVKHCICK